MRQYRDDLQKPLQSSSESIRHPTQWHSGNNAQGAFLAPRITHLELRYQLTGNPQNITPKHQAQIEIGSRHRERSVVALVEIIQHVSG